MYSDEKNKINLEAIRLNRIKDLRVRSVKLR